MRRTIICSACLFGVLFIAPANAKVSQEMADKLGGPEFTPMGSERAGNADGTIPEWTGGIKEPIAGYQPRTFHPDPFPDDPILFTITPDNVDQYSNKLSVGQIAMFKKYPDYKMNVYQSRRTVAYPQYVYDAFKFNALNADIVSDEGRPGGKPNGYSPTNAKITSPFPFPADGREIILNHTFRYTGIGLRRYSNQLVVAADGSYILAEILGEASNVYCREGVTIEELERKNVKGFGFQYALAPARIAGGVVMGSFTYSPGYTKAWSYNPGQRRVRRAPQIAYDNPGTGSDGLRFTDMLSGWLGSIDRYSWDSLGKKELYVPYNSYRLHSDQVKYDDIVRKGHMNMDLPRYELHRTWVVEAKINPGTSHAFTRRTLYFDEDSWTITNVDNYDKRGNLWRVQEEYPIIYYEVPLPTQTLEVVNDLHAARYIVMDADNETGYVPDFFFDKPDEYFNPQALKGRAKR